MSTMEKRAAVRRRVQNNLGKVGKNYLRPHEVMRVIAPGDIRPPGTSPFEDFWLCLTLCELGALFWVNQPSDPDKTLTIDSAIFMVVNRRKLYWACLQFGAVITQTRLRMEERWGRGRV